MAVQQRGVPSCCRRSGEHGVDLQVSHADTRGQHPSPRLSRPRGQHPPQGEPEAAQVKGHEQQQQQQRGGEREQGRGGGRGVGGGHGGGGGGRGGWRGDERGDERG